MHTWYEQAVFYHIYPSDFGGAEKTNTLTETAHRLRDLEAWIPHIRALNGSAIYIGPLFESSTHGYDTRDFRLVDRRLGTNEGISPILCSSATKTGSALWWTVSSTIPDANFSPFRIFVKNAKLPLIKTGISGVNFGWGSPSWRSVRLRSLAGAFRTSVFKFMESGCPPVSV